MTDDGIVQDEPTIAYCKYDCSRHSCAQPVYNKCKCDDDKTRCTKEDFNEREERRRKDKDERDGCKRNIDDDDDDDDETDPMKEQQNCDV